MVSAGPLAVETGTLTPVIAPCDTSAWRLVLDGGKSPAWMRRGCQALADLLPQSSYRTLPGQTHMVKPAVLAPALIDFLAPV